MDGNGSADPLYAPPSVLSPQTESLRTASSACDFCKKRKRKCDKRLPECSFCIRNKRQCRSPARAEPFLTTGLSPEPITASQPSRQTEAISSYFLDQEIFHQAQMQLHSVTSEVPEYVSKILGDDEMVLQSATEYFSTVHLWWSILSKKTFYNHVVNPLILRGGDTAMLLLCIKLITWKPSAEAQNPRTALYFAAKRYSMELGTLPGLAIRILQSNVLIALYEIGHGIYPAALLSISTCTRYGRALRIDLGAQDSSTLSANWLDAEEKRRVWWAVLILDQFSNINFRQRSLETEALGPQSLLPADDSVWDAGVTPSRSSEMTISNPSTEKMGRFAKLAQATHLLCQVLQHVSDLPVDSEFRDERTRQLEKTLQAMIRMSNGIPKSTAGAHAMLCYSALFGLHAGALNADISTAEDLERRDRARDILERVSKTCAISSGHYLEGKTLPADQVSALVLLWLYQAAAFYIHLSKKDVSTDHEKDFESLKAALVSLDSRWKVAGIYVRMLQAREIMRID